MSTSRHEGRIDVVRPDFGAGEDQFCDTVYLKHVLINGLNHLGDEWSQVRCNIATPSLGLKTGTYTTAPTVIGGASDDDGFWGLWFALQFPVTVLEPGTPYLFRFWIGIASLDAGADAELRAVLVPDGVAITDSLILEESDSVWIADTINGGAASAYITGATAGPEAYTNAIVMPNGSDGPSTSGWLAVFLQGTTDALELQLDALHLSEVVPV